MYHLRKTFVRGLMAALALMLVSVALPSDQTEASNPTNVLLVAADSTQVNGFIDDWIAAGNLNVTYFDARSTVPTVTEMQNYDVVTTHSQFYYDDQAGVGTALADYVDAGGNVVTMIYANWDNGGFDLDGRWDTDNYWAISSSTTRNIDNNFFTLDVVAANHPTLSGVSTVTADIQIEGVVQQNATLVANWSNGQPAFAYHNVGTLNSCVGSLNMQPTRANGDASNARFMANILTFVGNDCVIPPAPPTFTSDPAPNGPVDVAYTHTFTAVGDPTITFAVTSGTLPTGLSLSAAGVLDGTPGATGTFTGVVTATNNEGSATQDFSITIGEAPSITSPAPGDGVVGNEYTHSYTADGTGPFSYAVTTGVLPNGLSLSEAGAITGAPTAGGLFEGVVTATSDYGTDTQNFSITIDAPPSITSAAPPAGTLNTAYTHTYTATGDATITYAVTSGALPDGLSLSTAGVISGTPSAIGTFTGDVTATNDAGTDTQGFSITVAGPPIITSPALPGGSLDASYSHTLTAASASQVTFSVSSGNLPNGLSLNGNQITGTPTVADTFTGEITATDEFGSDVQAFSVTIVASNAVPVANDDAYTATIGQSLTIAAADGVLFNDTDADPADTLSAVLVQDVSQGTLSLNADGSFTYTSTTEASGTDTFTYYANDSRVNSSTAATVTITLELNDTGAPSLLSTDMSSYTENAPVSPTYSWVGTADATAYRLFVRRAPANATVINQLYPAGDICTNLNCEVTPTDLLASWGMVDGDYEWWVGAVNDNAVAWSGGEGFPPAEFSVQLPNAALPNVTVDVRTGRPLVTWMDDPNTMWVQIWLGPAGDKTYTQWVERDGDPENAVPDFTCADGTCSFDPEWDAPGGDYTAWLRAWGPGGYSEGGPLANNPQWNSDDFSLPTTAPDVSTLAPSYDGVSDTDVLFSWTGSNVATWYQIYVTNSDGPPYTALVQGTWFSADALGCDGSGTAGTCMLTAEGLASSLQSNTSYSLWIRAYGPGGFGTGGQNNGPWLSFDFTYDPAP